MNFYNLDIYSLKYVFGCIHNGLYLKSFTPEELGRALADLEDREVIAAVLLKRIRKQFELAKRHANR